LGRGLEIERRAGTIVQMELPNVVIDDLLGESGAPDTMGQEVRAGLASTPKRLPSKYFYDTRGSELFEQITALPEYYLTRSEQALLEASAPTIASLTQYRELLEPGAGSAKKTRTLIDAGLAEGCLERVLLVDVSHEMAERSAKAIAGGYPGLEVHGVVADFEADLDKIPPAPDRLVVLLGSTIGNFTRTEGLDLLRRLEALAGENGWLLLGTDTVKEKSVLEKAYNDSQGVTAQFNANILEVVNRHLDGNFVAGRFDHVAFFNEVESRIESYLRARSAHSVRLRKLGLEFDLDAGEMIHTEISCKYTRESVTSLLDAGGFKLHRWFTDVDETFALSLSRVESKEP
jgi:L-histidine N-alpha-methyltransferase